MLKIKKTIIMMLLAVTMFFVAVTYVSAYEVYNYIVSPNQASHPLYICGSGCVVWGAQTKIVNTNGFEGHITGAALLKSQGGSWVLIDSFSNNSNQTNVWLGQVKTSYVSSGLYKLDYSHWLSYGAPFAHGEHETGQITIYVP